MAAVLGLFGVHVGSRRSSTVPPVGSKPLAAIASSPHIHTFDDTRPHLIVKEGWMSKEGEVFKTWKKRYFRLQGLSLNYYTEKEEIKGSINLENAIIRESHRKNMDVGFEIVCNPSQAARDGMLLLNNSGELQYNSQTLKSVGSNGNLVALAASPTTLSSASSRSLSPGRISENSENPNKPTILSGEERIYYICLDSSTPNAMDQRKEWWESIWNNITFEKRLQHWITEKEDKYKLALIELRKEVETVRAEREIEQLSLITQEQERMAAEKTKQDELDKLKAAQEKAEKEVATALARDNHDDGSSAPALQAAVVSKLLHDSDASLSSGSLSGEQLVGALKRKNMALEAEVRMILEENERLKKEHHEEVMKVANQIVEQEKQKWKQQQSLQSPSTPASPRGAASPFHPAVHVNSDPAIAAVDEILEQQTPHTHAAVNESSSQVSSTSSSATASPSKPVEHVVAPVSSASPPLPSATTVAATAPTSSPSPTGSAATAPSSNAAAAAPGGPQSTNIMGIVACKCQCVPPCVPFPAHKSSLVQVNMLENRLAGLALEKNQADANVARYKTEKKVLKGEVIRLRAALAAQSTSGV